MTLRSLLFVPADSERKLDKARNTGADALILDLEDSVLPDRKAVARTLVRDYLRSARAAALPQRVRQHWVRINDLHSGELLRDLGAAVPEAPDGIILPKVRGPADLSTVGNYLDALESAYGVSAGSIKILALVTETPSAVLRMGELAAVTHPRLTALGWGAEDLSSALGAGDPRLPDGGWRPMYAHARSQCLLAAHALAVQAIDTVYVNFRDVDGLRSACDASRHDGFTGRFAIHPDQVAVINAAFTPGEAELALARRIVAAFEGGSGAVSLDGKMYDIPHLNSARRLIARM